LLAILGLPKTFINSIVRLLSFVFPTAPDSKQTCRGDRPYFLLCLSCRAVPQMNLPKRSLILLGSFLLLMDVFKSSIALSTTAIDESAIAYFII
jgi:hypothetical protein